MNKWIIISILLIDSIIGLILSINDLTYLLCLLNSIILPISLIISGNNKLISEFIFQLGLIIYISYSTYNIIIWYISFELILIPMIYLIKKGSGQLLSKYRTLYRFTIYTIISGLILLIIIIYLLIKTGNLNYWYYISNYNLINSNIQIYLYIIGIIPYLIKLPIMPFHIWLPDTHGEASTSGSIYLAAILLKLGALGIIRWLIPIFPIGYLYWKPLLFIMGLLSSIYASIITLRHIDLKKLIAYSSISHMGLILISLTNLNNISIYGFILLLISHGLISSLLFLLIGLLYVRTYTRYLYYFQGLSNFLPLFSIYLFIALLLNASLPPSLSYFAELHILLSQINYDLIGLLHLLISLLFAGFYSILLFVKISFASFYNSYHFLFKFTDLTFTEFLLINLFILLCFSFSFIF